MIITGRDNVVKKVAAVIMAVLLLCGIIPLSAFADDVLDVCPKCGKRTYETWNDCTTSIPDIGLPLSCKRPGIALPVSILTMIGIAWVSLAIRF